jgi:polyferredoxin
LNIFYRISIFAWFCKYFCPAGTVEGALPLMAVNAPLRDAAGLLFDWKLIVAVAIVAMSVFVYRFFCRFFCPLGAIYGLFNRLALYRMKADERLCTHCGRCAAVCEQNGHAVTAEGHLLHLAACTRCGKCVDACYVGALEMVGKRMTVDEVLAVVRRDLPFYQQSGGGMTLSGGEPFAQFPFTKALFAAAKAEDLHTAIETTAMAPWPRSLA